MNFLKLTAVIIIGLTVYACNASPKETINNKDTQHSQPDTQAVVTTPKTNWDYTSDVDKMDGDTSYFAETISTNTLNFSAPYDGGSTGTITVRKRNKRNEVMFTISKGQIMTGVTDDRTLRIKFDDDKPMTLGYTGTSDYDPTVIFINSPATIISKLKTANKVLLEIEYYNEGKQQLEFNVSGFSWHH